MPSKKMLSGNVRGKSIFIASTETENHERWPMFNRKIVLTNGALCGAVVVPHQLLLTRAPRALYVLTNFLIMLSS